MKRAALTLGFLILWGAGSLQAGGDLQSTLEHNRTHEASTWVDPDTGEDGVSVPTRTFEGTDGRPCREFTQTIFVAGEKQQAYGTACRQADGTWQIVDGEGEAAAPVQAREPVVVYREAPRYVYRSYPAYGPFYSYYPFFPSFSLSLGFGHFRSGHGWGHRHRR